MSVMCPESVIDAPVAHKNKRTRGAAVAVVVAVHLVILVLCAREKSVTSDEPFHIGRGVSALFSGDFRMSIAHPPLVNMICALPLAAFSDLEIPFADSSWQNPAIDPYMRKMKFFNLLLWVHGTWQWRGNPDPLAIIFRARVPVMIMSAALGILVYLWTARIFDFKGGMAALLLYCFSPTVLAHAHLVTTDIGAALFIFIYAIALRRHLGEPGWKSLLLCGIAFGMAQLAKYTAILLIPITPVILLLAGEGSFRQKLGAFFWRRPRREALLKGAPAGVIIAVIGMVVIWAGYGFELHSIHEIEALEMAPLSSPGLFLKTLSVRIMADAPIPPRTYYYGLSQTLLDTAEHFHLLYFMGRVSHKGWWYYYPVLFVIKEPIAFLLLLAAGFLVVKKSPPLPRTTGVIAGAMIVGMLFFFMFLNQKNIGIRHLLPVYPFLFIFAARTVEVRAWKGVFPYGAWVLLGLYVANAFVSYPDYLVHFNSLVGGPDGGLRCSVVGEDWGQDIKALGDYCRKNDIEMIYYNPYGNAEPRAYGVPSVPFKCGSEEPGWYAVHVVELKRPMDENKPDCYKAFKSLEPVAVLHHTIYVYRLDRSVK